MKKAAALSVAGSALAVTLSLTFANSSGAARPDSVAANAWIAITPDAGFVVTGSGDTQAAKFGGAPSVRGYLMVRRDHKWLRLEPEATGRMLPTNDEPLSWSAAQVERAARRNPGCPLAD